MSWLVDVTELLRKAQTKEIDGLRCFILQENDFVMVRNLVARSGAKTIGFSSLRKLYGLENFVVQLSLADEGGYAVCTRARPVLDELWESMQPENIAKEQP